jgi:membrane dipeptidase
MASALHRSAIVFDGLVVSNWSRAVFEDMRKGGITAANCTVSVWENFTESMKNVARFQRYFAEHGDILMPVRTTADIHRAKTEGKVGIVLGWQNTSGIEDQLPYLGLFKELGVGIMQLTYNTQNWVGTGCYESRDGGLSDFGREVVDEMNRLGILVDLSHVGLRTSEEAIRHSRQPVAFSHCCPLALKNHPRNKPDAILKLIAEKGGFVGVTMFPAFLKNGNNSTLDDYVETIEYVIGLAGEDAVGIGTDYTQGYGKDFFDWITLDKGYARRLTEFKEVVNPADFRTLGEWPNLTATMERRGWKEARIRKVLGENWVRLLRTVWGA